MTGELLDFDCAAEVEAVGGFIKSSLRDPLKRRGVVIGLSGGVDSSTCAALAARTLGPSRLFGILMPDKDSDSRTLEISRGVAEAFDIPYEYEDITPVLQSLGCYRRQGDAVRRVLPEFSDGWKFKIVLPPVSEGYRVFSLVALSPDGEEFRRRLPHDAYLQIVAATNYKQRVRKMIEYYHADRLNYAVIGTPNLLEYDQGFFVKNGDGAADIKPIAHLYKTQVYRLAEFLGVPKDVVAQKPTTDTYSLPQGQDEFFFSLSYDKMDLCLYAHDHGMTAEEAADAAGIETEAAAAVYRDIEQKRSTSRYLQSPPLIYPSVSDAATPRKKSRNSEAK